MTCRIRGIDRFFLRPGPRPIVGNRAMGACRAAFARSELQAAQSALEAALRAWDGEGQDGVSSHFWGLPERTLSTASE
jgi:hypothetical protein